MARKNKKQNAEATTATAVAEPVAAPAKGKGKKAVAAPVAPAAPATPKPPKTPGVATGAKTRAGVAGRVVAARGLAHGITEDMVAEVDREYGKPNAVESSICLRNAWHAITAYLAATAK